VPNISRSIGNEDKKVITKLSGSGTPKKTERKKKKKSLLMISTNQLKKKDQSKSPPRSHPIVEEVDKKIPKARVVNSEETLITNHPSNEQPKTGF